jgi:hypothetical protein
MSNTPYREPPMPDWATVPAVFDTVSHSRCVSLRVRSKDDLVARRHAGPVGSRAWDEMT